MRGVFLLCNIRNLSDESIAVEARLIFAEGFCERYLNEFCSFADPMCRNELNVKFSGGYLSLGRIGSVKKNLSKKKETWTIECVRGIFEFEILDKPEWTYVRTYGEDEVDELRGKRALRDFLKATPIKLPRLFPWKF